jgi:hypothetical protein
VNGDFRDALRRDRQTLKRRVELYGSPGHPRALDSGIAVARDLIEAGRYREATRTMTEVAVQAHDSLGDDARIALIARLWLGTAQRCAGDPGQAAENISAAVTGLVAGFGRLSLALNELALGQPADGRKGVEEVLAAYERRLRSNHPNVLICKLNMASALCLDEDYSAAKTHVDAAANGLRAGLGQAHPYTLAANFVQANVLVGLGRLDEALEVEASVLAERTRVLGGQHPDTLRSEVNLLLTERQRGSNGSTAELKHVTAELADALGAEHPDVAAAVLNHRLSCVVTPQPF